MSTTMNFQVHKRQGISWLAEQLLTSQGLYSMESVRNWT
jgi:hypothetical protein